jgi:hypothetical protein
MNLCPSRSHNNRRPRSRANHGVPDASYQAYAESDIFADSGNVELFMQSNQAFAIAIGRALIKR